MKALAYVGLAIGWAMVVVGVMTVCYGVGRIVINLLGDLWPQIAA